MSGECYIFGAGRRTVLEKRPEKEDYIIAADGGYNYCIEEGIVPNLIVGDFDSGEKPDTNAEVIVLPEKKDETDTFFAVKKGLERGFRTFHIYGGTGGREDHTIANIQTLRYIAERGGCGWLYSENGKAAVIKDGSLTLPKRESGYVSVFSLTDVSEGVTISGLGYELESAELKASYPMGVSNCFTGAESCISVKNGALLIMF